MPQSTVRDLIHDVLGVLPSTAELDATMASLFPTWPVPPTVDRYAPDAWIHRSDTPTSPSGRMWLVVAGRAEIWRDEALMGARDRTGVLAIFAGLTGEYVNYDARAVDIVDVVEILHTDAAATIASSDPLLAKIQHVFRVLTRDEAWEQSRRCVHAVERLAFPRWSSTVRAYESAPGRSAWLTPLPPHRVHVTLLPVTVEVGDRVPPGVVGASPSSLVDGYALFIRSAAGTPMASRRSMCAVVAEVSGPLGTRDVPIGIWCDRAVDLVAFREQQAVDAMLGRAVVQSGVGQRKAVLRADGEHALVIHFEDLPPVPPPSLAGSYTFLSWLRRFEPGVFANPGRARSWDPGDFVIDALFEVPLVLSNVSPPRPLRVLKCSYLALDGATLAVHPRGGDGWQFEASVTPGTPVKALDFRTAPTTPAVRKKLAWTPTSGVVRYKKARRPPASPSATTANPSSVAAAIDLALEAHDPAANPRSRLIPLSAAARATVVPILEAGSWFVPASGSVYAGLGDFDFALALAGGLLDEVLADVVMPRHAAARFLVGTGAIAAYPLKVASLPVGRPRVYVSGPFTLPPSSRPRVVSARGARAVRIPQGNVLAAMSASHEFRAFATTLAALRGASTVTTVGLRHEQMTQQVFAGSKGRYIPGPYRANKASLHSIPVWLDPAEVDPWLPPRLRPIRVPSTSGVRYFGMFLYSQLDEFDQTELPSGRQIQYDEPALAVFAHGNGRFWRNAMPRAYFLWIAPGNLMAQTVGREAYGYGKVLQGVEVRNRRVRVMEMANALHGFDQLGNMRFWTAVARRLPTIGFRKLGSPVRFITPWASGERADGSRGFPFTIVGWQRVRKPEKPLSSVYDPGDFEVDGLCEHLIDLQDIDVRSVYPVRNPIRLQPYSGSPTITATPIGHGIRSQGKLSLLPLRYPHVTDYAALAGLPAGHPDELTAAELAKLTP